MALKLWRIAARVAPVWPLALLTLQGWCARQAWRAWQGLPELPLGVPGHDAPAVSVVVPARDEAATLPALLPSLLALDYPRVDTLLIDDGSTDGTAAVAGAFGVRVVTAPPLPAGWTGKPHACAAGAAATTGEWLLFTDADTCHAPASLASALAYTRAHGLEALTLFPTQRCVTFWERLLVPYAYRHYFTGIAPGRANDPAAPDALANGQYLLIQRASYERIGGHAAVCGQIIEDVALAARFKREQVRFQILRAGALVEVRMYTGLTAIRHGFAKNSSRFLLANPRGGAWTLLSTILDGAGTVLLLIGVSRRCSPLLGAGVVSWLVAAAGLSPWLRVAGVPRGWAALQPLAAFTFQLIALDGLRALRPGATRWKGRRY